MITSGRAAAILAVLTLAVLSLLLPLRAPLTVLRGDEGTFSAMAVSLAKDFDLRFDARDRQRIEGATDGGSTVILQRGAEGTYAYSKPILWPLVAAPFYALFGDPGLLLCNGLALATALGMGWLFLRRLGSAGAASLTLVTFAGAACVLPYTAWRTADLWQLALALCGGVLCFASYRPSADGATRQRLLDSRFAPLVGTVLFGLLIGMRTSNALLAITPIAAALLVRRWRRALVLATVLLATMLAMQGLTWSLTGANNPYKSARTSFDPSTGYPVGDDAQEASERFSAAPATQATPVQPHRGWRRVVMASLYFLVGRHSGLLPYFPAALALLATVAWRADRHGLLLLAAFAGTAAFFVGWMPWNYFGGETFLGNRYLLSIYPALLVALRRLPHPGVLAATWLLAMLSYGSALASAERSHEVDLSSQNHAYAGVFRLLPYESTAIAIDGGRDRYWASHLVRFLDPWAQVDDWSFDLRSDAPATEMMVAEWRPLEELRFRVESAAPGTTLRFADRGGEQEIELDGSGEPRLVDLPLAPAWRRHPFWWDHSVDYDVRTLRLSLHSGDGEPASAGLTYLGDPSLAAQSASYRLIESNYPEQLLVRELRAVRLKIRNTSRRIWEIDGTTPVHLIYTIYRHRTDEVIDRGSGVLPEKVFPETEVDLVLDVQFPRVNGIFRLEIDLAVEGQQPFAAWNNGPVASKMLRVRRRTP